MNISAAGSLTNKILLHFTRLLNKSTNIDKYVKISLWCKKKDVWIWNILTLTLEVMALLQSLCPAVRFSNIIQLLSVSMKDNGLQFGSDDL